MSVASRNPFAILDDDDSRSTTPAAAPAPVAPAPAATGAPAPTRGTQRGRGGPASRGGRYYQRGGAKAAPREGQENGDDAAAGDAPKRSEGGRGRGRGRGERGRGRGGRGRPFDKHSQTGKTDTEKKVSQGWGADEGEPELKAETAAENDATAEANNEWGSAPVADSWGEPAATDAPAAGENGAAAAAGAEGEKGEGRRAREREPEEEDNTLTLDQYLKQKQELNIVPKLETRKANEGDDSIWKDAVAVSKKDEEESAYFVGKSKTGTVKPRTKKEEKVFLEIEGRFDRPARGGRGRGGDRPDRPERGGRGRGRGGRGRANVNGNGAPTIDVDDQNAFPSLA